MGNVFVHFIMYFVARARPCDGSIKSEASFFVNTRHLKVFFTVNCRRYRLFSLFIGVNVVHKNVPQTNQIAMSDFNQREKKEFKALFLCFVSQTALELLLLPTTMDFLPFCAAV